MIATDINEAAVQDVADEIQQLLYTPETSGGLLIALFVFIASPTATHVITEAALVLGVKPWKRTEKKKS